MKKSGLFRGIAFLAIGIALIFYAQSHSPKAGVLDQLENEFTGSYTLPEVWYYVCLGAGILLGVLGLLRTYRSMQ